MPGEKKKRSLPAKLGVSFLALVLCVLLAEAGVRLALGWQPYEHKVRAFPWMEVRPEGIRLVPDTHIDYLASINGRRVRLDINSHGFRGPELRARKPETGERVLFLGDSIVFGPGLESRETVPGRLWEMMGPNHEVISAGVPGMSIAGEAGLLGEKMELVSPDLVIVGFYMNDPVRSIIIEEEYGGLGDFWIGKVVALRRTSALFNRGWESIVALRFIERSGMNTEWVGLFHGREWVRDRGVFDRIIGYAGDDFGAAWQEENWPVVRRELGKIAELAASGDARLFVAVFPVSIQVEAEFLDDYPQARMKEVCEDLGIECLDLLPILRERGAEGIYYDQCHFTPLGADLAAREIYKALGHGKAR